MGCGRMIRAVVQAFAEFDIAINIGHLLNEGVQGIFLVEVRNQPFTDSPIETMEIVTGDLGIEFVGFIPELMDQHLKLGGVFVRATLGSLTNSLSVFDDVSLAVGCEVLFFEGFKKYCEGRERFDILIRFDVLHLCIVVKPGCSKTGLFLGEDFSEFHVLLYTKCPSGNGGDGGILPIEFIEFRNLN